LLLAPEGRVDYFEVFGLPRRLALDAAALRRRFYELAREHHPDFHQDGDAAARGRAEATAALVNAAYRALRDPVGRIEYLVRLEEGRDTREGAAAKPAPPAALLQEMFEIQEALEDARAGRLDDATRATLATQRARLRGRLREEEDRLTGPLAAAWDAAEPAGRAAVLAAFREGLAARAYLRTVIDDLGAVLDEPEGTEGDRTHVAHRRD
jgi:molecular chaperone HscB